MASLPLLVASDGLRAPLLSIIEQRLRALSPPGAPREEVHVGGEALSGLEGMGRAGLYRRGEVSNDVSAKHRRPERLLGRAGEAHRLDEAFHQGEEHHLRIPERLHQMVRGRRAQHLGELHRPASEGPRRPGRDPLGGRRPGRGQEDHLSRAARACLPPRQCDEGARRQEGRPRHDLHADDPGGGLRDARLRADRRGPLRRLRRLLAGFAREPHRGLPLRFRHHRRRGPARRQADPAEGQHRQGDREGGERRGARSATCSSCAAPAATIDMRGAAAISGTTRRSRRFRPIARRKR